MSVCEKLRAYLADEYRHLPESRYISILLLRTTQSEAIFRTEGSGEGCNREFIVDYNGNSICRAVISKRKQIAVERRKGRELLRKFSLLFAANNKETTPENICSMNRNNPCGRCIDCYLYGYAVGSGGAQKSRVISDDAFSLLPFEMITDKKTFNALYDNNTMRDPVTGESSTSINEDEYIVPGAHFLDIEVLKDVTKNEFFYVLGNILRSKRYGAITSRIGSIKNTIISIIGSDTEIFSTLEWVNLTANPLSKAQCEHPQAETEVIKHAQDAITPLLKGVCGNYYLLKEDEVKSLLEEVQEIYSSDESQRKLLKNITSSYPGNEDILT